MNGLLILTLPNLGRLSTLGGMRTRLEGTQASGEGELHARDANVADSSYGEPVNGKSEDSR